MKKAIKRTLTLVALAMLSATSPSAHAQEYFKQILGVQREHSIVREYTRGLRVAYNYNADSSMFILYNDTNVNAKAMVLSKKISVTDFEILNDTVFFCGQLKEQPFVAVLGYFDLVPFPLTTVKYIEYPDFKLFDRLDVYKTLRIEERHVVMTGTAVEGTQHIIDVLDLGADQWKFFVSQNDTISELYDDVAVTTQNVVVTARGTRDSVFSYVHLFSHPSPGSTMFYGYHGYICDDTNVCDRVLVEHCNEDTIVTVNKLDVPMTLDRDIVVSKYGSWNHVASEVIQYIFPVDPAANPKDVKYNRDSGVVDLLVQEYDGGISSIIYNVDFSTGPSAHFFDSHVINSLDYLTQSPDFFVAVGGYPGTLMIYRYRYNDWKACFEKRTDRRMPRKKKGGITSNKFGWDSNTKTAVPMECMKKKVTIETECYIK